MKAILTSFIFLAFLFAADASAANSISGRLLKSDGRPLAYTEIELVPIAIINKSLDTNLVATTGGAGNFVFKNVPMGEYDLSINFDEDPSELSPYTAFFYPNATRREDAQIFNIDEKTQITNLIFRLPPALAARKMTIKITDLNGKPAQNLMIGLRDLNSIKPQDFSFRAYQTKTPGVYRFVGFDNRKYQVFALQFNLNPNDYQRFNQASRRLIARGKTPIFVLDLSNANVEIKLEKIKETDKVNDLQVGALFPR